MLVIATTGRTALPEGTSPKMSINVVSYNIKHGAGMDGRLDLSRSANVLEALKPDLVALQEIDNTCTRSGGKNQAAELGKALGMHHAFGKFMDFQGGEYGLAVLSRYPILKTVRHTSYLPAPNHAAHSKSK